MNYDGVKWDTTIDVVGGMCFALYKTRKANKTKVNTALALSRDGFNWVKLGILKVDGYDQPDYFLLHGSIIAGCLGPIETETFHVIKAAALTKHVFSYLMNYRRVNLKRIFRLKWKVGSIYEHPDYPITYLHEYRMRLEEQ